MTAHLASRIQKLQQQLDSLKENYENYTKGGTQKRPTTMQKLIEVVETACDDVPLREKQLPASSLATCSTESEQESQDEERQDSQLEMSFASREYLTKYNLNKY